MGISTTAVIKIHRHISQLLGEVRRVERATKSVRLNAVQQERLRRAADRHRHALALGYPADFIVDNRYLLTELLLDQAPYAE